jgi:hypothetical protein
LTQRNQPEIRFVVIWGLGLLLIFLALPISLSPLKFIAKQSSAVAVHVLRPVERPSALLGLAIDVSALTN